jgi:class 3 adenylate cyclase
MTGFVGGSGADLEGALAYVVVNADDGVRTVPVFDQLFVGRECAGISDWRRLVIDDPEVSRSHLEIRLDSAGDHAFVIDSSTNGTMLNGVRLERAVPLPLTPGDEIRIGDHTLTFESNRFSAGGDDVNPALTRTRISQAAMVMVAGDITNYSTISQVTDNEVVAQSLNTLWKELGVVLRAHNGTLNHYAGDALYAVWELSRFPHANELAIDFALAANRRVEALGPDLPLRGPDGSPIHMGWGVVQGMAALAAMTRSVEAVIGDSTNVAFRLSGLAGRHGRAPVIVTSNVHRTVEAQFHWGAGEEVEIKGRRGTEMVFPAIGRRAASPMTATSPRIPLT